MGSRAKIRLAVQAIRADATEAPTYPDLLAKIAWLEALRAEQTTQIQGMRAELVTQEQLITDLRAQVERLEAELTAKSVVKDSHNSHRPPSSDDPYHKPDPKPAPRHFDKTKKRSVGGQVGHPGTTIAPQPPNIIIDYPLASTCPCGAPLIGELAASRQVHDLPAPRIEVTEHRTYGARCACGAVHRS